MPTIDETSIALTVDGFRRTDRAAAPTTVEIQTDADETSPQSVGHKAAMLAVLRDAGFRVPDFVVSPIDVCAALQRLGAPLAVRSSANCEDGNESSFAGQFRSFLNLNTSDEVQDAIRQCRESASSPAVVAYCRRAGFDPARVSVNVIVQRMIQPELAGVAFTVNPVTGDEEVVIEAVEGLADELLSGKKAALPPEHPLLLKYGPQIEQTARSIQRHFGQPQDIEFAIENGILYVLQSRPVTRIKFAPNIGEWTNADFRDGGVSSSVCTPLMWSLYELAWDRTLKDSLRQLHLFDGDFEAGRMFFGRPYWNLGAVKRGVAKLPGFVERDFDADLDVAIAYEGDGIKTPITLRGVLRAAPTLWAVSRFFRRQLSFDNEFLNGGFAALVQKYEAPPSGSLPEFGDLIAGAFFITEGNYFRTIFATSLAKLDFATAFPEVDHRLLVSALPPLRHMEPVRAVQSLADRHEPDIAELVSKYRHHYRLGLDVRFPRWDEDREFVTEMLQSLPSSRGTDPRPAYLTARADAMSRVPRWKRRSFRRKLDRLRSFVWLREEMRDLSNQMYYVIRRHVLEIARQKGWGDDVFFMTFREIVAGDTSRIARNRETYESYRNFRAPNEIRGGVGSPVLPSPSDADAMRGIGASPGMVQGTAHIAHSVQEALHMPRGNILVCPFTDPGWTPVLDRAAAVVTETGGLLSHAAVICREYGIPAVLGVSGATSRITRGSQIVVNGTDGRVERIESTGSKSH